MMLIFFGLLPALLIGIAALIYTIRAIIKKTTEGFRTYFIATTMILLFMVHSTVSTYVFSVFRYSNYIYIYVYIAYSCRKIDSSEFNMIIDLEISCFSGEHWYWTMFVGLPIIGVWGNI